MRLVSGALVTDTDPGSSSGRLEIYHSGRWTAVCDRRFDRTDADVACQQLGYEISTTHGTVQNLGYRINPYYECICMSLSEW